MPKPIVITPVYYKRNAINKEIHDQLIINGDAHECCSPIFVEISI